MYICNNATITFDGQIPAEVANQLNADYGEVGTFDTDKNGASVLYIEEVCGDISDELNAIVDTLRPYGIKPLVGECNRYYGDYDGYDVFDGAAFISMDDEDYGAWLNEQAHAKTIEAAKKVVDYCRSHKEEANGVYGVKCTENREFIPAELRTLIEELEKTMQK